MKKIPETPAIGKNLKLQRRHQKLSLDDLAKSSGVSKAMLSQIETGKTNPTVATMWKIAHALGLDFDALLRGEEEKIRVFEVTRSHDITTLETDSEGVHIQVLSPVAMANNMELYMLTFEPGAALDSDAHYAGAEEYLTVITGRVEVSAGDKSATLNPDDFAWYECDVPHCIKNLAEKPAKAHLVVRYSQATE